MFEIQFPVDVKFCLINDDEKNIHGILPKRAEDLSTGYDVYNAGPDLTCYPKQYQLIPLGFKAYIPQAYWLFLVPRSSTHAKKNMHTLYGVIDCSYENVWYFSAQYLPDCEIQQRIKKGKQPINSNSLIKNEQIIEYNNDYEEVANTLTIKHGEAVAQIIVMPRYEMQVNEINEEEFAKLCKERGAKRGLGGFGSTDKGQWKI